MTLQDFMDQVKDPPPETVLCVDEVDEVSGMNVAALEVVNDAKRAARPTEPRRSNSGPERKPLWWCAGTSRSSIRER